MTANETIKIIYYSGESVFEGERLKKIMEIAISPDNIAVCRSLESFARQLRHPVEESPIAVVLTAVRDELSNILLLKDLLLDRRLILVLPDDDPETLSQGHTLRPRFVSTLAGNYSDVAVVLERMVSHYENTRADGHYVKH
jgi:hypothetical protein